MSLWDRVIFGGLLCGLVYRLATGSDRWWMPAVAAAAHLALHAAYAWHTRTVTATLLSRTPNGTLVEVTDPDGNRRRHWIPATAIEAQRRRMDANQVHDAP